MEIALVEDQKLVELHQQKTKTNFSVGDIFLGKIKKIMPSLNAVFVDIGHRKDAFLHYTDMGPKLRTVMKYTEDSIQGKQQTALLDSFEFEPEIIKTGKVDSVLKKNENILIQILKEPISTKGPRLSCEITIPGRFIVLTPLATPSLYPKRSAARKNGSACSYWSNQSVPRTSASSYVPQQKEKGSRSARRIERSARQVEPDPQAAL